MVKITPKKFKEALRGSAGIITIIAQELKCSRQSVYDYLEKYPRAKELLEEEAEKPFDQAEQTIFIAAKQDVESARTLLLDHKRGRARGWGKKLDIKADIDHNLRTTSLMEAYNESKARRTKANPKPDTTGNTNRAS